MAAEKSMVALVRRGAHEGEGSDTAAGALAASIPSSGNGTKRGNFARSRAAPTMSIMIPPSARSSRGKRLQARDVAISAGVSDRTPWQHLEAQSAAAMEIKWRRPWFWKRGRVTVAGREASAGP